MDRPTLYGDVVVADGLPLERLYARFNAIARGRAQGDSSASHQSVIDRLAANQRRAEALGWSGFVLERAGGSGRLELRGAPVPGGVRVLVPDEIPYDAPPPTTGSDPELRLPPDTEARVGGRLANLSAASRMRWLDDGGR